MASGGTRGTSLAAVLTLALGVGANAVVFNLFNAYLWQQLPVQEPERLVDLYTGVAEEPYGSNSYPDYLDYRDQGEVWSGLLAFTSAGVSLAVAERTEWSWGSLVSGNYFPVLGVRPALGRSLTPEDDRTGAERVVVLSDALWRTHFGASPVAIGRSLRLNGRDFRIVGVAPRGFRGIEMGLSADFWVPLSNQPVIRPRTLDLFHDRDVRLIAVVGRLKPGVDLPRAQAAAATIAARLDQAYPQGAGAEPRRVLLAPTTPVYPPARARLERAATYLLAMSGLTLLIACVNVANLTLARALARSRELGIRLAVGASRAKVAAALTIERLLLALAAGGLGLLLALVSSDLAVRYLQPVIAGAGATATAPQQIGASSAVIGFTLLLSLFAGLLTGAVAAVQGSRLDLVPALKAQAGGSRGGRPRLRFADALVIGQVALCFVSLVGAGLALRGFRDAQSIDPGFRTEGVLLASLDAGQKGYSVEQKRRFYEQLTDLLAELPEVALVSLTQLAPLSRFAASETVRPQEQDEEVAVDRVLIGPRYFEALGIPVQRGRELAREDTGERPGAAVVNEAMARSFWPGEEALGKRLLFSRVKEGEAGPLFEVVGVVRDSKYVSLTEDPRPLLYVSYKQRLVSAVTLLIRTRGDPLAAVGSVRDHLGRIEPGLALYDVMSLAQHASAEYAQQRMYAELLSLSGFVALCLAAVGLYGVMSFSVRRRTREIGIRIALGAGRRNVVTAVVGRAVGLALLGVAIGLAGAVAARRALSAVLVGAEGGAQATLPLVALLLLSVAVAAAYLPARRAVRVDPVSAFKSE